MNSDMNSDIKRVYHKLQFCFWHHTTKFHRRGNGMYFICYNCKYRVLLE